MGPSDLYDLDSGGMLLHDALFAPFFAAHFQIGDIPVLLFLPRFARIEAANNKERVARRQTADLPRQGQLRPRKA